MARLDETMTICGGDFTQALELVQGMTPEERKALVRMLVKQYGMRVIRGVPDLGTK